jgi:hypothetical protein
LKHHLTLNVVVVVGVVVVVVGGVVVDVDVVWFKVEVPVCCVNVVVVGGNVEDNVEATSAKEVLIRLIDVETVFCVSKMVELDDPADRASVGN